MKRTSAVRVLKMDATLPSLSSRLHEQLALAANAARDFAQSDEPKDNAQRQRYLSLSNTLRAQANSLRAEVADAGN